MSLPDYYRILGVSHTATPDEIKLAYRHLALHYHPDLHPDNPHAEDILKAVNQAYDVLSDAQQRRQYDAQWADVSSPTINSPRGDTAPTHGDAPWHSSVYTRRNITDPYPVSLFLRPSIPPHYIFWGIVLILASMLFMNAMQPRAVPDNSASHRVIEQQWDFPVTQVLLPRKNNAVQIDHLLPGQKVIIRYKVSVNEGRFYVGVKNVPAANGREAFFMKGKWITTNDYSRGQLEIPISVEGNYVVFAELLNFNGSLNIDAQIIEP